MNPTPESKPNNAFWWLCTFALFLPAFSACAQLTQTEYTPFKYEWAGEANLATGDQIKRTLKELAALQDKASADDLHEVAYWNAAYPSYRWHQILMDFSRAHRGHKNGGRVAILHLAVYDALVAAWKQKEKYDQPAPYERDRQVVNLGRARAYSSFVCEWSAAAGAAHTVIGYYFPDRKEDLDSLLLAFRRARLLTGLQFPSDVETGLQIGREIGQQYIAYAREDRTDRTWEGQVPEADSLWSGNPGKWDPMKAQWRPLTLESADQFRPGPPPTDWSADMEELRQFNATHASSDIAWKWKSEPVWDRLVERKILEYDLDPLAAAFANAVFHAARFDGIIAAWDGKYHYWGIRPFQYDPEFKPILVDTPNFPGYPAGHTTVAGSIATVLSFLFPRDENSFHELARECSESRFEGGVHFRTDNEVGLEVGYQVGKQVWEAFAQHR